jgi:hypothetical protein
MLWASQCSADIIADSIQDFSGRQGLNGWTYGYWDESGDVDGRYDQRRDLRMFRNFGADPINRLSGHAEFTTGDLWYLEDGRFYTSLWAEGGHPHGALDLGTYARAKHWTVRRWASTVSGLIEIRGHAGKVMPWGENWDGSVKFRVVVDGNPVYEAEADDVGKEYSAIASVEVGTAVDFLIGPGTAIGVSRFTAILRKSEGSSSQVPLESSRSAPNFMLNCARGDVLRSNQPHLAAGQLARR